MALKEFLASTIDALSDRSSPKHIHVVLGNEACDLDSVVSAITYAFFRRSTCTDSSTYFLPVLNIPRGQYQLRVEVVFFLGKHGIEPELLTFVDDFDLQELTVMDGLTLTVALVDHHVLKECQQFLKDKVTEVIDHRPLAEALPESWEKEVEWLGSCCTLVARRMLDHQSFSLDATIVQLLIGTILVDTNNMSVTDQIATDADHVVVMSLNSMLPEDISPNQIYQDIRRVKFDISSLTVKEMLYKDMKVLRGSYIVVAMSTITMHLKDVLSRPEFSHDASAFSAALPADANIIMTVVTGDESITSRCIAVYSASRVYRDQLTEVLLSSTNPNLGLQMMELPGRVEHVTAFDQTNLKISRKGVLPLIREFLAGEATLSPDDENMNALGICASSEEDASENVDEGNMQMRRHINLAKTAQCDQFRTSLDQFDLAAVGTDAVISPSLSSDSEFEDKSSEENPKNENQRNSDSESRTADSVVERVLRETSETSPVSSSVSNSSLLSSLMAKQDEEDARQCITSPTLVGDLSLSNSDTLINPPNNPTEAFTEQPINDSDDVLDMHSPFELLCPATDSPLELLSLPTSGQISGQESGQGSKVPSYPGTPPNSYVMSPVGPAFVKQTQLPSFNSKEMVEKIQQKKKALNNRRRRGTDEDGCDDADVTYNNRSDGLDFFNVLTINDRGLDSSGSGGGGGRSRGGGSLISPAVPQNSYGDLVGIFSPSQNYDIPALARADIEEKVIEKRSHLDWDGSVPYTPQNSYVEGGAGALAMGSLTSFNSAEMVARIRAKQAAMFNSSGRASGSSEDSLGCYSPEGVQRSRGISLESPAQAYTPQNSYKDGLSILDGQGRLPDLNEVAERLSTDKLLNHGKRNRRSTSNSGDDDGQGPGGGGLQKPGGRHSSSQSDSQNTMSDVESLMSVSTDIGTPSDNVVAHGIAGAMRTDMMSLSRKDTGDSEVFTPAKGDDKPRVAFGFLSTDCSNPGEQNETKHENHEAMGHNGDTRDESGGISFPGQVGELFSPLDDRNMMEEEVQYFQVAENIVAKSIAAAMEMNQSHPRENGDVSTSCLGFDNQTESHNRTSPPISTNFKPDEDGNDDDEGTTAAEASHTTNSSEASCVTDSLPVVAPTISSGGSLSDLSSDVSSFTQEVSIKKRKNSHNKEEIQKDESSVVACSNENENHNDFSVNIGYKKMTDHEEKLAEAALSELAYEWARDLIQGVLDDFNLSQVGLEPESLTANGNGEGRALENGNEALEPRSLLCNYDEDMSQPPLIADSHKASDGIVDWSRAGNDGMLTDLSIVITTGDDGRTCQGENGSDLDEDMDGFSIEALDGSVGDFVRDDTVDVDEEEECLDKEIENSCREEDEENEDEDMEIGENRQCIITSADDHSPLRKPKTDAIQMERKLSRGSSSSPDSIQNSERKWSRETDKSLTIMENEMSTNFPEWKALHDDYNVAEDEDEPMVSFPGRKISISEDYPRRFSRDDDLSRRSSKFESDEGDMDSLVRPDDLETDYLPNMDPFQGSLDIISNEASISKISAADREVVEGESFRRVSGHELETDRVEEEAVDATTNVEEREKMGCVVDSTVEGSQSKIKATSLKDERVTKVIIEEADEVEAVEELIEQKNTFQEQSLPSQSSPSISKKKRIRVSFSEEVTEEDGTSYQILPRHTMRSPPPPLTEHPQNPTSSTSSSSSSSRGHDEREATNRGTEDQKKAAGSAFYQHGKEIYFTSAGRISIAGEEEDAAFIGRSEELSSVKEDPILGQEKAQVSAIMASITETVRNAESSMAKLKTDSISQPLSTTSSQLDSPVFTDPCTDHFNPSPNVYPDPSDQSVHQYPPHPSTNTEPNIHPVTEPISANTHPLQDRTRQASTTSLGSVKGAEYRDEWQDDNIQDVAQQAGIDSGMTDDNRKKIHVDSNLVPGLGEEDVDDDDDDDDDNDRDSDVGDLEWENDTPIHEAAVPSISTVMTDQPGTSQRDPQQQQQRYKRVVSSGSVFDVDLELVAPYKNVLSHGGYFDEGLSAVIVFYGFNLPSRRQEDYHFIMKHLFHYVVHTLEELVADDYVIVYFHGSTPRRKMPGLGWLKRCYQCIDRRLKKNLKGLYLVHPTLWLRTIVTMTRPFISSKFSSKLKFVRDLDELQQLVPLENVTIPDAILHFDMYRQHLLTPPSSPTPSPQHQPPPS